ncbi:hypothetical protein Gohar_001504 [Gossypium harknessii]|uniref:Uncharacterized protein n=2 Tax=Gossypium TaxID=3633 RepID=A0A7J8NBL1_9ROSI|nr:hypothetical protein [Gossypium lobatum]MBA0816890.1 hypothetical protein [Gossypium harknessii]
MVLVEVLFALLFLNSVLLYLTLLCLWC